MTDLDTETEESLEHYIKVAENNLAELDEEIRKCLSYAKNAESDQETFSYAQKVKSLSSDYATEASRLRSLRGTYVAVHCYAVDGHPKR